MPIRALKSVNNPWLWGSHNNDTGAETPQQFSFLVFFAGLSDTRRMSFSKHIFFWKIVFLVSERPAPSPKKGPPTVLFVSTAFKFKIETCDIVTMFVSWAGLGWAAPTATAGQRLTPRNWAGLGYPKGLAANTKHIVTLCSNINCVAAATTATLAAAAAATTAAAAAAATAVESTIRSKTTISEGVNSNSGGGVLNSSGGSPL